MRRHVCTCIMQTLNPLAELMYHARNHMEITGNREWRDWLRVATHYESICHATANMKRLIMGLRPVLEGLLLLWIFIIKHLQDCCYYDTYMHFTLCKRLFQARPHYELLHAPDQSAEGGVCEEWKGSDNSYRKTQLKMRRAITLVHNITFPFSTMYSHLIKLEDIFAVCPYIWEIWKLLSIYPGVKTALCSHPDLIIDNITSSRWQDSRRLTCYCYPTYHIFGTKYKTSSYKIRIFTNRKRNTVYTN